MRRIGDYKPFKSVDGCKIVEVIGMKTTKTKDVSVAYATIKPEQKTILHKHGFVEVYVILQGRGIMYIGYESRPVRKGDNILIPAETWHQIENTGKTNLKIMCICTPAFSKEKTRLKK
mgnify:CR=1 FL=1